MNPDFSTCFPYQLDDYIPNIKYQLNYWGEGYGPFNYRDIINDIHDENPNDQIKVYPNPFRDDIKIEGLPCIELSLTLYDLTGRLTSKTSYNLRDHIKYPPLN